MTTRTTSFWLLSAASMLLTPVLLGANPPASTEREPQYELFSSVTGSWAKVNDLDPLKPMSGDRVIVAVSSNESFEIVLSGVEEAPRGLRISWIGSVANEPGSHVVVGFTRAAGDPKARFAGGTLDIPGRGRLFTFRVEKERPGWTLVSEHAPAPSAPQE
jgi:hypothetical protein